MASTRCWKCEDRPSSRPGGLCYTCWVAAGKPDKEKADAMRAAGTTAAPELSSDLADALSAMRFVVGNPASADVSHQQKAMREWRETSPTTFFNRLGDLEKIEMAGKSGNGSNGSTQAHWDGEGACPTCKREATNPLLDELLRPETDLIERVARHHAAVVVFLDREGLL
jgi:hypothetical protein